MSSYGRREQDLLSLLIKTISSWGTVLRTSSKPNCLLKAPSPSAIISHRGLELQHVNCGGTQTLGFPGSSSGKEPACQRRRCKRLGFDPGSRRSSREENGNSLQYSCLENPIERSLACSGQEDYKELEMNEGT